MLPSGAPLSPAEGTEAAPDPTITYTYTCMRSTGNRQTRPLPTPKSHIIGFPRAAPALLQPIIFPKILPRVQQPSRVVASHCSLLFRRLSSLTFVYSPPSQHRQLRRPAHFCMLSVCVLKSQWQSRDH